MAKSLLLVIDLINDIVNPESKVASCAAHVAEKQVIAKVNQAIAWARKQQIPIAHVKLGFSDDYFECAKHSLIFSKAPTHGLFKLSGWGCEFHYEVDVHPQDKVIIKRRVSAFYGTDLETILRVHQIEKLYLAGVSTNMAIELTAREAHDRDYQAVVITDACGSSNEEMHQIALKVLQRMATLKTVAELNQAQGDDTL